MINWTVTQRSIWLLPSKCGHWRLRAFLRKRTMMEAMGTGNIIDGDFVLSRHEGWRMRAVVQFTTCRDSFQEFQSHAQQATPGRIEMHISMCAHGLAVLSREVGYLTLFPHFHLWIIKMPFTRYNQVFHVICLQFFVVNAATAVNAFFPSFSHFCLSVSLPLPTPLPSIFFCPQATEEGSLCALESLMTEFFHSSTTNERKREIGKVKSHSFTFLTCLKRKRSAPLGTPLVHDSVTSCILRSG